LRVFEHQIENKIEINLLKVINILPLF